MVVALGLGLLAVSAVMLVAGAELFTENVGAAARRMGITVFAAAFLLAGAEPEEMITAVIASGRHRPGLAAGDAIGANLTMLTLVLALARPLRSAGGYAGTRCGRRWRAGWPRWRSPPVLTAHLYGHQAVINGHALSPPLSIAVDTLCRRPSGPRFRRAERPVRSEDQRPGRSAVI